MRNCRVIEDEILREHGVDVGGSGQNQETYRPVRCKECNTEIGVVDNEEVYHFFHVLASQS